MAKTKNRKLDALMEMTALINSTLDSHEVRVRAIEAAASLLGAEAGSLLLIDPETKELFFEVALGKKGKRLTKVRLKKGQGIAGWVSEHGKPLIIHDASKDPRFFRKADELSGFLTRNLLCVPVKTREKTIGVLEVINKKRGRFNASDMEILSALSNQVAVAIDNARLYEEAVTDSLTGLYHHKYFEVRLKEEVERARRYGHHVSLLMLDIDFFKAVNDKYGHLQGDRILEKMAEILKSAIRLGDIPARYGGEEFCLILPHTEERNALRAAERLRSRVESADFGGMNITISAGAASFDGKDKLFDHRELIRRADTALYLAKKNGRNRVERFLTASTNKGTVRPKAKKAR